MYERIVLATDGSEGSKAAVQEANKFVQLGVVKKLLILHAVKPIVQDPDVPMAAADLNSYGMSVGDEIVARTKDMIVGDTEVEVKVLFGDPPTIVCDEAKREEADLIIMGSRGMGPAGGLFLGSVSTRVLHYAPCPVLIAVLQ